MRRVACALAGLAMVAAAAADEVRLRDGTIVGGNVLAVTATTLELDHCGVRESYLRSEVAGMGFAPGACADAAPDAASARDTLPPGTAIVVTLRSPIDSGNEPVGQVFQGRVRDAVLQGPRVLLRQGAPVLLELRAGGRDDTSGALGLWLTAIRNGADWTTMAPALPVDAARTRAAAGAREAADDALSLSGPRLVMPVVAPLVFVAGGVPDPDRRAVAASASVQRP